MTEDSTKMDIETAPKKVGFLLGAGIVILPFVFAWFTLRKGYGRVARFVSLGWMGLLTAMLISSMLSSAAESKRLAELEVAAKSLGFASADEMETLQKQGFKTKAAFVEYVAKTPISPPDAEYAAQCYGLALVWNDHALDEKAGLAPTAPTDLTDGLNKIINDYTNGVDGQSFELVNARQEYHKAMFEKAYTVGGMQALVGQYTECKGKLGQAVVAIQEQQAAEQAKIDAEEKAQKQQQMAAEASAANESISGEKAVAGSGWIRSEEKDKMTDAISVSYVNGSMQLLCSSEKAVFLSVDVGDLKGTSFAALRDIVSGTGTNNGPIPVKIRLDSGVPFDAEWRIGFESEHIYRSGDDAEFFKQLSGHRKLIIKPDQFLADEFNISGSDYVYNDMKQHCK
jgi:hypothetical protein